MSSWQRLDVDDGPQGAPRANTYWRPVAALAVGVLVGLTVVAVVVTEEGEAGEEAAAVSVRPAGCEGVPVHRIALPPHFVVEAVACSIPGARCLAVERDGGLLVTTRRHGLFRVPAGRSDAEPVFGPDDFATPDLNGIASDRATGRVYLADQTRVLVLDAGAALPRVFVDDAFPAPDGDGFFWLSWHYLALSPDGTRLFATVGPGCALAHDPCLSSDPRHASILAFDLGAGAGATGAVVARGVRFGGGLAFHPATGEAYFGDNAHDADPLHSTNPADELNRLVADGSDFGYPWCTGANLRDPSFPDDGCVGAACCANRTASIFSLGLHVAPLGMQFFSGPEFSRDYYDPDRGIYSLFVAEHGSAEDGPMSNGRKVARVIFDGSRVVSYVQFARGWETTPTSPAWGRPVDVLEHDGTLLISDDVAGAVYRVRREN